MLLNVVEKYLTVNGKMLDDYGFKVDYLFY